MQLRGNRILALQWSTNSDGDSGKRCGGSLARCTHSRPTPRYFPEGNENCGTQNSVPNVYSGFILHPHTWKKPTSCALPGGTSRCVYTANTPALKGKHTPDATAERSIRRIMPGRRKNSQKAVYRMVSLLGPPGECKPENSSVVAGSCPGKSRCLPRNLRKFLGTRELFFIVWRSHNCMALSNLPGLHRINITVDKLCSGFLKSEGKRISRNKPGEEEKGHSGQREPSVPKPGESSACWGKRRSAGVGVRV